MREWLRARVEDFWMSLFYFSASCWLFFGLLAFVPGCSVPERVGAEKPATPVKENPAKPGPRSERFDFECRDLIPGSRGIFCIYTIVDKEAGKEYHIAHEALWVNPDRSQEGRWAWQNVVLNPGGSPIKAEKPIDGEIRDRSK